MATQIDRATPDGDAFLDGLSDEDMALFAESLAIQRELEEEDGIVVDPHLQDQDAGDEPEPAREEPGLPIGARPPLREVEERPSAEPEDEPIPDVVPIGRARRKPVSPAWRMLAAAAVVLVVVTPFLSRSLGGGGAVRDPSDAVAAMNSRHIPADRDAGRAWGTRGPGDPGFSEEERAARVGAYIVDLELTILDRRRDERLLMANGAAELLKGAQGNAALEAAAAFRAIGNDQSSSSDELIAALREATDVAEDAVDRDDHLALGAWAEAAGIAAGYNDEGFFRSGRTRATLRRAETVLSDNPAAQAALTRINALLEPGKWDPKALEIDVNALLTAIT